MRAVILLLGFICATTALSFPSTVLAADIYPLNSCTKQPKNPGEINIVTYNIGDDTDSCKKCTSTERMKALIDLMETNQADIIALQEVWIRKGGKPEPHPDLAEIIKLLGNKYQYVFRGHSDDALTTKGMPNQGHNYGNMLITRLPILKETYKEYVVDRKIGDGEGQRYFFSVGVETPQGVVRIIVIHTRAGESAWGVTEVAKFAAQLTQAEPDMPSIVLGDFNQNSNYIKSQLGDKKYGLQINFGCINQANCYSDGIDLLFPNQKINFMNRCRGSAQSNGLIISGPHVPVYATFALVNPLKPGDLDRNGRVDIFDYNMLLGAFGKTGAPGFHPADILKNGAVDIFDYNEILKALAPS